MVSNMSQSSKLRIKRMSTVKMDMAGLLENKIGKRLVVTSRSSGMECS
jgi:hypothetical protein